MCSSDLSYFISDDPFIRMVLRALTVTSIASALGIAALKYSRKFCGCEIDESFFELAKKRLGVKHG